MCSIKVKLSVKVELCFVIMCTRIPPGKVVSEMAYIVSGGTLNSTHSLTHWGISEEDFALRMSSGKLKQYILCQYAAAQWAL